MQAVEDKGVKTLSVPCQSLGGKELYVPRKKLPPLERTEEGVLVMTHSNIKTVCEMDGLYEFP